MTSPVEIPFRSFVNIQRDIDTAIYLQIANQVSNAIQRGVLVSGAKLPGTRTLSQLLDVHRQTLVQAYQELESQGWIETKPNRGAFVVRFQDNKVNPDGNSKTIITKYPAQTGFSFTKSNLLDSPFEFASTEYLLDDGVPDIRLTQVRQLSGFYSANMKRKSNLKKLDRYNSEGSEYFKAQLTNYLNYSRGLHIAEDNLLITRSTEMSVYIASEILLSVDDTVVVGNLSYFSANMIFQKSGAKIKSVPIDDEGLDVEGIRRLCQQKPIRMVYVTSHHHYPTTVTLSAQRRLDLLNLAEEYGFIILEDDYDYEFQYDRAPILPLASADTKGMVVYIGTFGRSLAPGFRTGFIVAPQNLLSEMQKHLGIIDRQGDIMMEYALGEMIEEGEIHRYLKKSLKIYEQRRNHCCALLAKHLGDTLKFEIPTGGLAVWTEWNPNISLYSLAKRCQERGLFIPKTLLYQSKQQSGIRIGFGKMNGEEMEKSIDIITSVLKK